MFDRVLNTQNTSEHILSISPLRFLTKCLIFQHNISKQYNCEMNYLLPRLHSTEGGLDSNGKPVRRLCDRYIAIGNNDIHILLMCSFKIKIQPVCCFRRKFSFMRDRLQILFLTLSEFKQINPFYATVLFRYPLKHRKTRGFLMFSGGIERDHWHEMG